MATEEEKILSIKVDYKEAITKIADYKAKLDALKESERKYKDEVKDGTITQEEYNKNITAARLAAKEYRTAINVLEKSITGQIKTQKSNADILAEVEGLMGQNVRSIAEAEAANKALREAVRSLSDEEESAYAIRQKLNAQIDENTNYIRRNSDEYIKLKMNIGAYTESIKNAYVEIKNGGLTMNSVGIVAKGFSDLLGKQLAQGFADASHAGTRLAGVLRLVKVAFLSIPIVAVVAALAALVTMFTKTQKGMETFQKITSGLGAAIDVVIDRLAMLGSALMKVFKGDWTGAADTAKRAISGIGEELKEEIALAVKLKEALIGIEKEETMLKMSRAANKAEIEALKKVAEDTTKTEKERLEAAQKAYELEQKDMDAQVKLQKSRVANMLGYTEMTEEVEKILKDMATGAITADEAISKIGISESTIDDLKEVSDAVVELYEAEESSTTRQIELQNKLNSIRKEANDAYLEKLSKETDAIREMEDALLNIIKDNQERQRKEIELSYDREIEDLKKRLETEKDLTAKAREAITETIKAKEIERKQELDKLSAENVEAEFKEEYDRQLKLAEARLAAQEAGSAEELELKKKLNDMRMEEELRQYANDEEMKLAIRAEYLAKNAALDKSYNDNKVKEEQERAAKEVEIEQAKYEAMSAITGGLVALTEAIGESDKAAAVASKVLALAQIAIETGKAIAKMVSAESGKGILGLGTMATGIATILANIATAIKTVKGAKFATGGDVSGAGTATSDSIPAMLSNGESVLTAAATNMFAPILSAFNQAGGGVPIYGQQTGNQAMGEDMLARAFAKGVASLPSPIVSVEEINNVGNRVKVIENISSI